jgi:cystathionine beta-lyase/cystathionine gamma-synthase
LFLLAIQPSRIDQNQSAQSARSRHSLPLEYASTRQPDRRLSVGLQHLDDLIRHLTQALVG